MHLFSFKRGGINPKSKKTAAGIPITNAHLPHHVVIPMRMHAGTAAKCLVKPGDRVEEGQRIGEADGAVSAHIHASVSGKVTAVEKRDIIHAKGVECVIIETGGTIRNWYADKREWNKRGQAELLEAIRNAGVVGLGGACYPSHLKLSIPAGAVVTDLLVNAVESEPFLSADGRLLLERPEDVLEGVKIARKLLGNPRVHFCVGEDLAGASETLAPLIAGEKDMQVAVLKNRYPQGSERLLIQAVLGREVPSGKLPREAGAVAFNAATLVAVFEAVVYGKPLIDRIMTYAGFGVREEGNFKVRIGTPVRHLAMDHGLPEKFGAVIAGGPLSGYPVSDLEMPVVKGMGGITVLSQNEDYRVKNSPCIRCARCVNACPAGLNPSMLSRLSDTTRVEEAEKDFGLLDCIECGACSYVCPSTIPLVSLIRWGKDLLKRKRATLIQADKPEGALHG